MYNVFVKDHINLLNNIYYKIKPFPFLRLGFLFIMVYKIQILNTISEIIGLYQYTIHFEFIYGFTKRSIGIF